MNIQICRLSGAEAHRYMDDLARLRMAVFKEYPYLYDGNPEYEAKYLKTYLDTQNAVLIAALNEGKVIGMASGLPLAAETPEVINPVKQAGYKPEEVFYLGESVLLPQYRGRGTGKVLMNMRIEYAVEQGFRIAVFCAVSRPEDHPLKPDDYRPLDGFWHSRGFAKQPDLTTGFTWKDIDKQAEDEKTMVFWIKQLV